uniref:Fam-c protein n=1 Tax=Parastrongyloides trichosuri TaxID=131310 RepID=A0A0N4ZWS2_PARTI
MIHYFMLFFSLLFNVLSYNCAKNNCGNRKDLKVLRQKGAFPSTCKQNYKGNNKKSLPNITKRSNNGITKQGRKGEMKEISGKKVCGEDIVNERTKIEVPTHQEVTCIDPSICSTQKNVSPNRENVVICAKSPNIKNIEKQTVPVSTTPKQTKSVLNDKVVNLNKQSSTKQLANKIIKIEEKASLLKNNIDISEDKSKDKKLLGDSKNDQPKRRQKTYPTLEDVLSSERMPDNDNCEGKNKRNVDTDNCDGKSKVSEENDNRTKTKISDKSEKTKSSIKTQCNISSTKKELTVSPKGTKDDEKSSVKVNEDTDVTQEIEIKNISESKRNLQRTETTGEAN